MEVFGTKGMFPSKKECVDAGVKAIESRESWMAVFAWKDGTFSYGIASSDKTDDKVIDYQSGLPGMIVERFPIKPGKVKTGR